MRKIIQFQTRQRVLKLLDKNQDKTNLQQLKKSRYMRQDYKQTKKRLTVALEISDFKKRGLRCNGTENRVKTLLLPHQRFVMT